MTYAPPLTDQEKQQRRADNFAAIARVWPGDERNSETWARCPFCDKDADGRKPTHFSYSLRGYKCFSCGESGGLWKLVEVVGAVVQSGQAIAPQAEKPKKVRRWKADPDTLCTQFQGALDTVTLWSAYKPLLSIETMAKRRLAVGVLPSSPCQHRRLIYPVIVAGVIVGFRGRAITCTCAKWITAGGSDTVLVGLDELKPGQDVIVAENPVDTWIARQFQGEVAFLANTAGSGTWKPEWTAALVIQQPRSILVWYDNDLGGIPNTETHQAMTRAWQREHPGKKLPTYKNGVHVVETLRAAGLPAIPFRWPAGTPEKADMYWAMEHAQRKGVR